MRLTYICFVFLVSLSSVIVKAQVSVFGASHQSGLAGIPTQAFGAVYGCSADSSDQILRQYNLPGCNGRLVYDTDVMQASDGRLYGVTQEGKSIFSLDTLSGDYQLEFLFPSFIEVPVGAFAQASNGKLYGVTIQGGAYMNGVLYEYDPLLKTCIKKYDFPQRPTGSLLVASDGMLYGGTLSGLYRFDPLTNSFYDSGSAFAGTVTVAGYLLQASDGKIYGHTTGSGFSPIGSIFAYDPVANTTATVFTFPRKTTFLFCNGMIQASDGKLYGLVCLGPVTGGAFGSVFEFDPATSAFSFDYDFVPTDVHSPRGRLVQAASGKLYGAGAAGSLYNSGGIFEYDILTGVYATMTDFGGPVATGSPFTGARGGLYEASNGKCYGITYLGGVAGVGELFDFDPLTGIKTTKFSFNLAVNGSNPVTGLTKTSTGILYGTTQDGGLTNEGVLFKYDAQTNAYTTMYDFADCTVRYPASRLTEMPDGTFLGTGSYDSLDGSLSYSYSVIYQWLPLADTIIKRYVFPGPMKLFPSSDLLLASDGNYYGTALLYPASGPSTVVIYSFDPLTNNFTLEFDYGAASNNMSSKGNLLQASNGKIYGTLTHNGTTVNGRLFEYDIVSGILTDKYFFDGSLLGTRPAGGLIEAVPGKLYGLVSNGTITGDFNGQLYEYDILSGTCIRRFQFTQATDGLYPYGDMIKASNGKLYGMTTYGKVSLNGTIFEYDLTTDVLRSILEMDGTSGVRAVGHLVEFSSPLASSVFPAPSSLTLCDLSQAVIPVSVGGTGPFSYQWQMNAGSGFTNVTGSIFYSGVLTSVLTIDSVLISMDSVQFRCVVNSAYGSDTSGTTQLFVKPLLQPLISGPAAICPGDTVLLSSTSMANANYAWQYAGSFIPGANDSLYLTTGSGSYSVIVSNSSGCADTSASYSLLYGFLPAALISSTSFCPGDSALLVSDYTAASFQWLLNGAIVTAAVDSTWMAHTGGDYSLLAYSSDGCSDTSAVIHVEADCDTWPGDTDNDSIVDNNDLLPIGIYYGSIGTVRAGGISNVWQAWDSNDWGVTQVNGQDIKHADSNGDGTIDDNDTLAVDLNFTMTHAISPSNSDVRLTSPAIYLSAAGTTYMPGDWIDAEVWLGTASVPVNGLYGIAFNIDYNASLVQPGTETLNYPPSWLGTPGTDALTFDKVESVSGRAYGAETRIDHINKDGFGKISTFRIQLRNTITIGDSLVLTVSCNAVDSAGSAVIFDTQDLTLYVSPVGIDEMMTINNIVVYPNPYAGSTNIQYSLVRNANVQIEVYNAVGQKIQTIANENQSGGSHRYSFSASDKGYDAGIYFVKFTVDGKVTMKKIVEMK